MNDLKISKKFDSKDPVYQVSGLTDSYLNNKIIDLINEFRIESYIKDDFGKYHLNNEQSNKIIENSYLKKITSKLLSPVFLEYIGNLLYNSNSSIIEYLDYLNIFSEKNKKSFLDKLSKSKYKLIPLNSDRDKTELELKDPQSLWVNNFTQIAFDKDKIEELMLAVGSIVFYPKIQISLIRKNGYIPIHVDREDKILSLMIYLPKNEEQMRSRLGTTFYKPKGEKQLIMKMGYGHTLLPPKSMDNFQKELYRPIKTDFNGENAIFFFRSNSSWHSFEYDDLDIGERLSININFFFPLVKKLSQKKN
tara:strand:+ start:1507 stop:2424 length:918 start_codon:yes stop_codon:yes gene_type:complete